MGGITCNAEGFAGETGVVDVLEGGERDTNNLLSCSHYPLKGLADSGQQIFNIFLGSASFCFYLNIYCIYLFLIFIILFICIFLNIFIFTFLMLLLINLF